MWCALRHKGFFRMPMSLLQPGTPRAGSTPVAAIPTPRGALREDHVLPGTAAGVCPATGAVQGAAIPVL
jgi:hypothetical protein